MTTLHLRSFIIITFILFIFPFMGWGQHSLIPEPVEYHPHHAVFVWDQGVGIAPDDLNSEWNYLVDYFTDKLDLSSGNSVIEKPIHLTIKEIPQLENQPEGYHLLVKHDQMVLTATSVSGLFYGLQTIRQLKENNLQEDGSTIIPGCEIVDYPRFGWRGLMLDVSRHFFSVEEVKAFIDLMAYYKMNTFHWHLTDDEGWRIEIKSYPKLTEIGAWRVERYGRFGESRPYPQPGEKATYGGFYTQEEIKEVVKYATERMITIVPEIDVPGHSMAALAAYPELSVKNEPKFVNPGSKFAEWYGNGKFKMLIENTLNPAEDKVYTFLDGVFTEVAELFPGPYIHMGGDECYKGYWEEDPEVQKFMRENDIHDAHELQSYFVKRVEKIISSKGKKLIGWDEILEGGLAEGAAVMSWRGMSGGIEAAKAGHQVVMSPTTFCYLDYTQGDHSLENRIYADLSLAKTYEFEPVPADVDPQYILGGQGNVWTEVIPDLDFALYMTYPRAISLAETLWSPKANKDWTKFVFKLDDHIEYFQRKGWSISTAHYEPQVSVKKVDGLLQVHLDNQLPGSEIYYTIDNTYPVHFGEKYRESFTVPDGDLSLRAQTYQGGKPLGRVIILHRKELERRAN